MPDYTVTFARSARKELENLSGFQVRRILPRIENLGREPRPHGCRKLQGEENLWRIRIGDYRVIYAIHDVERVVDVTAVRHRKDAYQ